MWRDVGAAATRAIPFAAHGAAADIAPRRRRVLASEVLLVEDSALPFARPLGRDYSPDHQVVLPYFGAFGWRVGGVSRLIDANGVLFVTGRQEFDEDHPVPDVGHGSAILTPDPELLDELAPGARGAPFAAVTAPMTDAVRLAMHRLLFAERDPLALEETGVAILRGVVPAASAPRAAAKRVIERAKRLVHDLAFEPLSLARIARDVGVSPIYLSQSFTRSEGVPLYRYQMRLRLGRALVDLPHSASLTELALDLGFSSHSHFTAVFRAAFGLTPSQFRTGHRTPRALDS